MFDWLEDKLEDIDWLNVGKWLCLLGGGLLTLIGGTIFGEKIKEREFTKEVSKQVKARLDQITKKDN